MRHTFAVLAALLGFSAGFWPALASGAAPATRPARPSLAGENVDAAIARIRDEGLNRSQVMQTLSYLTDVIGPRLTGSPNLKRANEWTRDKLSNWGLADAHLEGWPFGRGWSLKRFSAQVVEPQAIPLIAYPKAWSPGFEQALTGDVVYLDAGSEADLQRYRGKLKGAIVLSGPPRPIEAHFEPLGGRLTDAELLALANYDGGGRRRPSSRPAFVPPTTRPRFIPPGRLLALLIQEEAALLVEPSPRGDGGTIFVDAASIPGADGRGRGGPRAWSANAPATVAQIVVAAEDYNRMVRMIRQGQKLKMAVDLRVEFHSADPMAYNTIAEIPGADLKDQIVMLGAHMDSMHVGTGATDDAAGVAVCMEAVRILKALNLKPRRTIRIGLWGGEEQGFLGSKAYVGRHFGSFPEEAGAGPTPRRGGPPMRGPRQLVRLPEYDRFSGYFNFDNGGGRIRGIHMQGNDALWPTFRRWLAPFRDLDAATISPARTGGTDHLSFDAIGLPGFQFIQDPIEYMTRTHHSTADVYDRVPSDDLKQAAVIMAGFVYNAAMADERLPRKPIDFPGATTRPAGGRGDFRRP